MAFDFVAYMNLTSIMADGAESSGTNIKINVKTPKDKKEIEINPDANIKEVCIDIKIIVL